MTDTREPDEWRPTERVIARAERSKTQLRRRLVPIYDLPLYVSDDEEVVLRDAPDVARRILVLWAVVCRAEGMPKREALELVEQGNLWSAVSPNEERFLRTRKPDPAECTKLVWRLECIWVLLWALHYKEELEWPSGMPRLVEIVERNIGNAEFISKAKLRSVAEVLDAQDLTMRIHWAIRDALINDMCIPADLDWSRNDDEGYPPNLLPSVGVVAERHYALNWLVRYGDADWDDVDTPT